MHNRDRCFHSRLSDGVLAVGGNDVALELSPTVYKFHGKTRVWTRLPDMHVAMGKPTLVFLEDNAIGKC